MAAPYQSTSAVTRPRAFARRCSTSTSRATAPSGRRTSSTPVRSTRGSRRSGCSPSGCPLLRERREQRGAWRLAVLREEVLHELPSALPQARAVVAAVARRDHVRLRKRRRVVRETEVVAVVNRVLPRGPLHERARLQRPCDQADAGLLHERQVLGRPLVRVVLALPRAPDRGELRPLAVHERDP